MGSCGECENEGGEVELGWDGMRVGRASALTEW